MKTKRAIRPFLVREVTYYEVFSVTKNEHVGGFDHKFVAAFPTERDAEGLVSKLIEERMREDD